jgi:hypothetical protein
MKLWKLLVSYISFGLSGVCLGSIVLCAFPNGDDGWVRTYIDKPLEFYLFNGLIALVGFVVYILTFQLPSAPDEDEKEDNK